MFRCRHGDWEWAGVHALHTWPALQLPFWKGTGLLKALCRICQPCVEVWCLRTYWAWIEPSVWGASCKRCFLQLPEKVTWEHAWGQLLGYGVPYVLRVLVGLVFFLKVSGQLLVSCLFTEMGLAESVPRACKCLAEARLDGQKPSEVWEGACKAGSAAGSVEGEKSSCRNFTLAVVVTLRPLVREHREKE